MPHDIGGRALSPGGVGRGFPTVTDLELVSVAAVRAAAANLDGVIARTHLLPCRWLGSPDAPAGDALWLKPENLQVTGAFKIRGAYNALTVMSPERRTAGVITASSGNHGQALAYAAARYQVPCVVVMPDAAVPLKVAATRELHADVVFTPAAETHARAHEIARTRGLTFVPPFSDRHVIAGQGTIGLEILEDLPGVELVLVPVGGGGLAAGVAAAVKALKPSVHVVGIEPEVAPDAAASFTAHAVQHWSAEARGRTVADGLRSGISEYTLAHLMHHLDGILTVSEAAILAAVRLLATRARLVAEPSGAVALAGYLCFRDDLPPGPAVAVVSGGNIEPALLASLMASSAPEGA